MRGINFVIVTTLAIAAYASEIAAQVVSGDFNGDNRTDLAIGVRLEDVGAIVDAGAVHVLYGTGGGLRALGNQFWHQNSPGVLESCEGNDQFGSALATGDFDGDGFDDLAIGVPGETISGVPSAGAVNVLYGSAAGLSAQGDQLLRRGSGGLQGGIEAFVNFGASLASGDLDNDGFSDLIVGVVDDSVSGQPEAGSVHVIYGSSSALSGVRDRIWHQNSPGIAEDAEDDDNFGSALAVGDFNSDGFDDVCIGVLDESVNGIIEAGAVHVLYGSMNGLKANGSQLWHENSPGISETAEAQDKFGQAIAVGDFNRDGLDDLAIGVPGEDVEGIPSAGSIHVLYGTSLGLSANGEQLWNQESPGIKGASNSFANFGTSLAAGDFDGNDFDDLAIGIPDAAPGSISEAGAVAVLYGSHSGIRANHDQRFHQNSAGMLNSAEAGDEFGEALGAGDFDGDGYGDLVIGIPFESIGAAFQTGAVAVLYGSSQRLTTTGNQFWHQNRSGIADVCETGDSFGAPPLD